MWQSFWENVKEHGGMPFAHFIETVEPSIIGWHCRSSRGDSLLRADVCIMLKKWASQFHNSSCDPVTGAYH